VATMNMKNSLFGLILSILWACNNTTTHEHDNFGDDFKDNNSHNANKFLNDHFEIDTTTILTNKNLQPLIDYLDTAELNEKKSISEIPVFIKVFLDSLTNNFSIANPGEDWQVGCTVIGKQIKKKIYDKTTGDTLIEIAFDNSQSLPSRQLIYLGLGQDIALITYYSGGIGKIEHVLILKFDKEIITDFWCGTIGSDIKDKDVILKFLKENKDKQWGLNSNIIYL
jgi:hypothetical protein